MNDVPRVGGKNASLGEMISNLGSLGVEVPDGFATTAHAFDDFLDQAGIRERIHQRLDRLDTEDVRELALAGAEIRGWVIDSPLPDNLQQEISVAYRAMSANGKEATVAVRSSATAEDLPDASFAGQQETFLNISGLEQVLHSIKLVFASLFNDSAWCAATWRPAASCSVSIPNPDSRMPFSSPAAMASVKPWCRVRSIRTSFMSTRRI
jgi:pyruvate,water dikinase